MGPTRGVLTPDLCRTFVLLARNGGSVTAAARELGVNPATVSKQIRPLVRGRPPAVPRPWLAKAGKRFALTDEGRRMLAAAEDQAGRWAAFAALAAADRPGGVAVACGQEAAGGAVLAAAAGFRKACPGVPVRVAVVRGRERVAGVASGRFDLALVTDNPAGVRESGGRELVVEALAEDELVLACAGRSVPPGFAGSDRPADADDVAGWPLVLPQADAAIRRRWDELLRRRSPSAAAAVAVEAGGWRVLLGYVQAGFGVGLLPRSVASAAGPKVRVRELAPPIRPANRLYLVTRPDADGPAAAFRAALVGASPG